MEQPFTIALAGHPNVGKSTVFNRLTGLKQHTGNWAGKTVGLASGSCTRQGQAYRLLDIPGCYSLGCSRAEEAAAREYICFGPADAVVLVCDAVALQRSLQLALQISESGRPLALAVNLLDEARRQGLKLDLAALEAALGVPVVGICASRGQGLGGLLEAARAARPGLPAPLPPQPVAPICARLAAAITPAEARGLNPLWLALGLLSGDTTLRQGLEQANGQPLSPALALALTQAQQELTDLGWDGQRLADELTAARCRQATALAASVSSGKGGLPRPGQLRADRFLTRRSTGLPVMLLLLGLIFFLTIKGANWPSAWLSTLLFAFQKTLGGWLLAWGAAPWLHGLLIDGIYQVLAWVIAAMLPPMMIFFPLFSLLEDWGYLPRLAFNLDRCFQCCRACGKQALTMCMGFGCNAVGVTGCRIIDSPREKLLAILTNSFVPCNGKYPLLIVIISAFFTGGAAAGLAGAGLLSGLILLGIGLILLVSRLLSATILRGQGSSFSLELPPYRKPQILATVARSMSNRVIFVLGRAVLAAAPAGALIWLLTVIQPQGVPLLLQAAELLDPFGRWLGLDGVIVLAFILALPANELVLPLMVTCYLACGTLTELENVSLLRQLLLANGWTWLTACNTLLFTLCHWPCATTLLTIRKETKSWAWTALAFALPTLCGLLLCAMTAALWG